MSVSYLFEFPCRFFFPLFMLFCLCIQAEEEALMLQQYVASQDTGQFENRIRSYIGQIHMVTFISLVAEITENKTFESTKLLVKIEFILQ